MLLAIDTSSPATTVVVAGADDVGPAATVVDNRRHAEVLAVLIADELSRCSARPSDLERVVVGVGPGPFTGLRVGIVTALAWGDALGIPVHGIASLDGIAWQVRSGAGGLADASAALLVTSDARRREVFSAIYPPNGTRASASVSSMADALERARGAGVETVVGAGVALHPELVQESGLTVGPALLPDASALARLAVARLAEDASGGGFAPVVPQYLRRPDAASPAPRKRVTPA